MLLFQGRIVDPTKYAWYVADDENEMKMWKTYFYDGDLVFAWEKKQNLYLY